jgi:hypothetical protein
MPKKNETKIDPNHGEITTVVVRSGPYRRFKELMGFQPHLSNRQVLSELIEEYCDRTEKTLGESKIKDLLKKRA